MGFIDIPNLPQADVRLVLIDGRTDGRIIGELRARGVESIATKAYPGLYSAISHHPDIFLHPIGGDRIVYAPGISPETLTALDGHGFCLIRGAAELGSRYPMNIAFNVARVGHFAIHNFRYTDPVVLEELKKLEVELINVKQGYAKCSVSVVDEKSIITSDKGIARAADKKGMDVLLIEPERGIRLPGLDMGFIGGSTGLLGRHQWAVTGDLDSLKSGPEIRAFLLSRNIEPVCLSPEQIVDVGSILPIQI